MSLRPTITTENNVTAKEMAALVNLLATLLLYIYL